MGTAGPIVAAVHRSGSYTFSKAQVGSITLVAGLGVEGDAHAGALVRHRSRVARDPSQPNLRQVLLFTQEMLDLVADRGFDVAPGELGENVTTSGVDLYALPTGTVLRLGADALIVLTGLRNPCGQINGLHEGLLSELRSHVDGRTVRRGGVMAVVVHGGEVSSGDAVLVALPPGEPIDMDKV
ncbi:MAG: MOSC domain-containing protein [Ilumatobacteraceae bacterium]